MGLWGSRYGTKKHNRGGRVLCTANLCVTGVPSIASSTLYQCMPEKTCLLSA